MQEAQIIATLKTLLGDGNSTKGSPILLEMLSEQFKELRFNHPLIHRNLENQTVFTAKAAELRRKLAAHEGQQVSLQDVLAVDAPAPQPQMVIPQPQQLPQLHQVFVPNPLPLPVFDPLQATVPQPQIANVPPHIIPLLQQPFVQPQKFSPLQPQQIEIDNFSDSDDFQDPEISDELIGTDPNQITHLNPSQSIPSIAVPQPQQVDLNQNPDLSDPNVPKADDDIFEDLENIFFGDESEPDSADDSQRTMTLQLPIQPDVDATAPSFFQSMYNMIPNLPGFGFTPYSAPGFTAPGEQDLPKLN